VLCFISISINFIFVIEEIKPWKELRLLQQEIFAKALSPVDVANARHHASLLAKQAVVLQTRSVRRLLNN